MSLDSIYNPSPHIFGMHSVLELNLKDAFITVVISVFVTSRATRIISPAKESLYGDVNKKETNYVKSCSG